MQRVSRLATCIAACLVARGAGAQAAGVVAPPPAPPKPPPPAVAAAKPTTSAAARRDSLALAQRLDIQAWVDSAAGALAAGAPATTVPLTAPPPASPADSARIDSARIDRARIDSARTPRSRRPTPVRHPRTRPATRPDDMLATSAADTRKGMVAAVADAGTAWYLRRRTCLSATRPASPL
jgi:hypothetical protein